MTTSDDDKTASEKAKEAGDKLVEGLRPNDEESPGAGEGGSGVADPFSGGDRPDEQPT